MRLPLPGGEARPMRVSIRAEHPLALYLAALSPAMLRLTGEVAAAVGAAGHRLDTDDRVRLVPGPGAREVSPARRPSTP